MSRVSVKVDGAGEVFFSTSITMGTYTILNGNGLDDPETTDDDWAAKQKSDCT